MPVNVSQITRGDIYEIDGRNGHVLIMMRLDVKDGDRDVGNNVVTSQKGNHKCGHKEGPMVKIKTLVLMHDVKTS